MWPKNYKNNNYGFIKTLVNNVLQSNSSLIVLKIKNKSISNLFNLPNTLH